MLKNICKITRVFFSQSTPVQKMIRVDKELDETEIRSIVEEAFVLRLGLYDEDDGYPYVVPMNYGIDGDVLYIHSSSNPGKRTKILGKNPKCCFEIDLGGIPIVPDGPGCDSTCMYSSVIGYGNVSFIEDFDEKVGALETIMKQNAPEKMKDREDWGFLEHAVKRTAVLKIDVHSWTGKQSPPPRRDDDL